MFRVSSSATWSSRITDFHSRGARPAQRTRTPSSCISSRRRRITSRLKPIRNRTSSGERRPVLGGEGVRGDRLHPDLDRALDDVEQGGLALLVALGARQPPLLGPAAVAVHDDRDVPRAAAPGPSGSPGGGRREGAAWVGGRALHGRRLVSARRTPASASPRSRCQARYAATRPLRLPQVPRVGGLDDRPVAGQQRAEHGDGLGAGLAEPGTRHVAHSTPPIEGLNQRCGPASPHRAQCSNDGA